MQAGPLDDSEVLRAVAHGDRDSLGTLYDRHAPAMLALGMRIVGVRREVEDLLHDVFLEAWRHAGDYDPRRGSVKTWLLLRMRSRCLDRVRSHGFSRVDPLLQEPMRSQAADRTERGVDGARVRALVRELPQGQREVLELGYFAGFSFQEIADQLGIPIGTVKSRVSAAMVKLRSELGVPPVSREEAS
ncbi:MAG TPA: sigma-70 family RNA polymerase sigma factor [Polyangiales bacterium]|nr:sigma-70 family RNA polymerase sigma factor [Polyangiales bacterium]